MHGCMYALIMTIIIMTFPGHNELGMCSEQVVLSLQSSLVSEQTALEGVPG